MTNCSRVIRNAWHLYHAFLLHKGDYTLALRITLSS
ncbi:DUF3265 domain-containing protein [Vibrio campbellii]|nr:DUF3265 domain-containing protein [Vibrio campbellii]